MGHAAHQHQPVVVVDDVALDQHAKPARWYYHVECLSCAAPLPQVVVDGELARAQR